MTLKLVYFDIPGAAEPIRLALHHAELPFEDFRFSSREEFTRMKVKGELAFGQVPALQIAGGPLLVQSKAILRVRPLPVPVPTLAD